VKNVGISFICPSQQPSSGPTRLHIVGSALVAPPGPMTLSAHFASCPGPASLCRCCVCVCVCQVPLDLLEGVDLAAREAATPSRAPRSSCCGRGCSYERRLAAAEVRKAGGAQHDQMTLMRRQQLGGGSSSRCRCLVQAIVGSDVATVQQAAASTTGLTAIILSAVFCVGCRAVLPRPLPCRAIRN
jgi:hypothetical protein